MSNIAYKHCALPLRPSDPFQDLDPHSYFPRSIPEAFRNLIDNVTSMLNLSQRAADATAKRHARESALGQSAVAAVDWGVHGMSALLKAGTGNPVLAVSNILSLPGLKLNETLIGQGVDLAAKGAFVAFATPYIVGLAAVAAGAGVAGDMVFNAATKGSNPSLAQDLARQVMNELPSLVTAFLNIQKGSFFGQAGETAAQHGPDVSPEAGDARMRRDAEPIACGDRGNTTRLIGTDGKVYLGAADLAAGVQRDPRFLASFGRYNASCSGTFEYQCDFLVSSVVYALEQGNGSISDITGLFSPGSLRNITDPGCQMNVSDPSQVAIVDATMRRAQMLTFHSASDYLQQKFGLNPQEAGNAVLASFKRIFGQCFLNPDLYLNGVAGCVNPVRQSTLGTTSTSSPTMPPSSPSTVPATTAKPSTSSSRVPATTDQPASESTSGMAGWLVAVIVVGSVFGIAGLMGLAWLFIMCCRGRTQDNGRPRQQGDVVAMEANPAYTGPLSPELGAVRPRVMTFSLPGETSVDAAPPAAFYSVFAGGSTQPTTGPEYASASPEPPVRLSDASGRRTPPPTSGSPVYEVVPEVPKKTQQPRPTVRRPPLPPGATGVTDQDGYEVPIRDSGYERPKTPEYSALVGPHDIYDAHTSLPGAATAGEYEAPAPLTGAADGVYSDLTGTYQTYVSSDKPPK